MEILTFKFAESVKYYSPFQDYLQLRKRYFIDELGWSLWTNGQIEMDQFDNPNTFYTLALIDGTVVAGSRLVSSDNEWFGWRNLLVDAAKGRIEGIPHRVFPPRFDFSKSWESSRLVVDQEKLSREDRFTAVPAIGNAQITYVKQAGGGRLLSMSPPSMARVFRMMGLTPKKQGERYRCHEDNRDYDFFTLEI